MTRDAARAQELLIENLPDPTKDDEIEETLQKLKKFDEELMHDKNESIAVKGMKGNVKVVA